MDINGPCSIAILVYALVCWRVKGWWTCFCSPVEFFVLYGMDSWKTGSPSVLTFVFETCYTSYMCKLHANHIHVHILYIYRCIQCTIYIYIYVYYVCICMYMYVYVCICMYMYVYVCICMYMYVYVCICMYMYVYVCICMYIYYCIYTIVYKCAYWRPSWTILTSSHLRWEDHLHPGLHQNRAVGRGLGSPWLRPSTLTLEGSKKDALEVFGVVLVIARWRSLDFIWVTSFLPSFPSQ